MKYRKIVAIMLAAIMTVPGSVQIMAEEIAPAKATESGKTVSDNGISELGLHGMTLDAAMLQEKMELNEVVEQLEKLEEGSDYSAESLYFVCEDEDEAREIADCYGAELDDYDYGVGIIDIADMADEVQDMSVSEIVTLAADMSNSLPAIYPDLSNYSNDYNSWGERYEADLLAEAEAVTGASPVDDPKYPYQWAHKFMKDSDAWDKGITGSGVKIAIIDTGVRADHEDLKDNIIGGYNAIKGVERDYDDSDLLSVYGDIGGHGTHVAGIAAAKGNNGLGGAGVAPDASILAVRVFTTILTPQDGYRLTAYDSHLIRGINYAVSKKADVINMSLGKPADTGILEKAIKKAVNKGVVVVCSAGNSYDDALNYPAAYDCTISVAALSPAPFDDTGREAEELQNYEDEDDISRAEALIKNYKASNGAVLASYSTTGSTVDVSAPGSGYYSSYYLSSSDYVYFNGTSMASPAAAGAAALILQAIPGLLENRTAKRCDIVRDIMRSTAYGDEYTSPWTDEFDAGYGMSIPLRNHGSSYCGLNVSAAVNYSSDIILDLKAPSVNTEELKTYDSKNLLSGSEERLRLINPNTSGTIYYTTDGTTPNPKTAKKYKDSNGIELNFSGKLNLKAIVVYKDIVSPVMSFKQSFKAKAESVAFAPTVIKAGGKAKLLASVSPSYAEWPKFTWNEPAGYTITGKNGKYTIKSPANATAAIVQGTAANADGSTFAVEAPVYVTGDPIERISFAENTPRELFSVGDAGNVDFSGYVIVEKSTAVSQLVFTSTNSDVIYITPDGQAVAKKSGKATIKVVSNDGSNKSAKIKVKVKNPVFSIDKISTDTQFNNTYDFVPIANGGTIKLSAEVNNQASLGKNYKKPTNGKLQWVVAGDSNGATVDDKGVLRLPMSAAAGDEFTVTAQSTDGFADVSRTIHFKIYPRAQSITLSPATIRGAVGATGAFDLTVNGYGYYDYVRTSFSKSGICHVYTPVAEFTGEPGYGLQCLKKGSVKITYYIPDGSGVKAVQRVTVK